MGTIKAKDFKTRADLENYVRSKFGLTTNLKEDIIEGKRADLSALKLSDESLFWGLRVKITDTPTVKKEKTKVNRGKTIKKGKVIIPKNKKI